MPDTPRWSLARLPLPLSRFLGYRPTPPPHSPIPVPPFSLLSRIPAQAEKYMFGFTGAFISLFLIMMSMTLPGSAFSYNYHSSLIVASFGASAVLVFGAFEAPLAQPRNLVGGQFVSALIGVCLTKLFALDSRYHAWVQETDMGVFRGVVLVNGCLSMALSLAAMEFLGVVHPPAGATALLAAVSPSVVRISWHYLPVVLTSSLIMLGVGLINNNLGRKRYPLYWWKPGEAAMQKPKPKEERSEGSNGHGSGTRSEQA